MEMTLKEGKDKFIQSWGTLGSNWGINRTMAQIHALLLVSPEPLCAEDIRQELHISMGNANMNLRALIDWGLVYKKLKSGERKEFFVYSTSIRMNILASVVGAQSNVVWSSDNHSSTPVYLFAKGPGDSADAFKGILHTTEWAQEIIDLL